jgi:hypothetical protein
MANLPAMQPVTCALVNESFISVAANAERTHWTAPNQRKRGGGGKGGSHVKIGALGPYSSSSCPGCPYCQYE